MRMRLLLLAPLALLAFGANASATPATTCPCGIPYEITVDLVDKGAVFADTTLPRGLSVRFEVVDDPRAKKAHEFTIFGQSTPWLEPGQKATINVILLHRGTFPWTSASPPSVPLPWWSRGTTKTARSTATPATIRGSFTVF